MKDQQLTLSPLSPLLSRAPYPKELAVAPLLCEEGTGISSCLRWSTSEPELALALAAEVDFSCGVWSVGLPEVL